MNVSANVTFINHDTSDKLLNDLYKTDEFESVNGCIKIGDNVLIGANVIILPNVCIGSNVVIGAGAVVTKDIPDNSVAGGVPCGVLGSFDAYAEKRRGQKHLSDEDLWEEFNVKRK